MFWWDMFWELGLPMHRNAHWATPPKLDMFWWVVGFKVLVSKVMFCGAWFLTSRNEHWATTEI